MCGATVHQASPVSTVDPPQTAWNSTPAGSTAASSTSDRRRGLASQISRKVPSEAISTTLVSVRLPNSIAWWNARQVRPADRDQRPGLAFRPGRAAETGPGDPDRRAGDGDQPVRDHRRPGERPLQPERRRPSPPHRARRGRRYRWGRSLLPSEPPYGGDPADDDPGRQHQQVGRRAVRCRPAAPRAGPATSRPAGVSSPIVRSTVRRPIQGHDHPADQRRTPATAGWPRRAPPRRAACRPAAAPSR